MAVVKNHGNFLAQGISSMPGTRLDLPAEISSLTADMGPVRQDGDLHIITMMDNPGFLSHPGDVKLQSEGL